MEEAELLLAVAAEDTILALSNKYHNKLSTDELIAMDKTRAVLARLRQEGP
jgi:hypothetical protein